MTSPAMLAIENVAAGYGGVLALQDVSITARPGTITAVLGAGSGWTAPTWPAAAPRRSSAPGWPTCRKARR